MSYSCDPNTFPWQAELDFDNPDAIIANYVRRGDYVGLAMYMNKLVKIVGTQVYADYDVRRHLTVCNIRFDGRPPYIMGRIHRDQSSVCQLNVALDGFLLKHDPHMAIQKVVHDVTNHMTRNFAILACEGGGDAK